MSLFTKESALNFAGAFTNGAIRGTSTTLQLATVGIRTIETGLIKGTSAIVSKIGSNESTQQFAKGFNESEVMNSNIAHVLTDVSFNLDLSDVSELKA